MGEKNEGFVAWEEHILCHERGNRVVHYFLKQPCGNLVLAVVGTERSIRHMMYVVADDFVADFGPKGFVNACTKWRARREVVEWLSSLVSSPESSELPNSPTNNSAVASGSSARNIFMADQMGSRKFKFQSSTIEWSGDAWLCSKQLKHYPAFTKNEITIMVHSFVYIMALDDHPYLGYLEDMYEDKKGKKKVKVRWFHQYEEVKDVMPLLNPHPKEVFITPNVQVISAECIDGPAIVLTPKHYEKCMADMGQNTFTGIHMCFRQFKSHKLRPFTLAKLRGYNTQPIVASLDDDAVPKQKEKSNENFDGEELDRVCNAIRNPGAKIQTTKSEPTGTKLKFKLGSKPTGSQSGGPETQRLYSYKIGEKIEVLSQDSGIRGCWFQCKILKISTKKLMKVQYKDVEDADGLGRLVEWISHKVANSDKLGMRVSGRLTIRPSPQITTDLNIEIGTAVDAWWCDGWWEGVVTGVGISATDSVQVYFPGEGKYMTLQKKEVRASRDWFEGKWVDIKARPDILSYLPEHVNPKNKLSAGSGTLARSVVSDEGGQGSRDLAGSIEGLRLADKGAGNIFIGGEGADAKN